MSEKAESIYLVSMMLIGILDVILFMTRKTKWGKTIVSIAFIATAIAMLLLTARWFPI